MNLHVIKQKKPWKDDIGDILRGGEYIKCLCTKEVISAHQIVYLPVLNINTWPALGRVGIARAPRDCFGYECPWSDNRYYHFMPHLILAKSNEIYRPEPKESWIDHAFDSEWIRKMYFDYQRQDENAKYNIEPDSVTVALRGHGYTHGTLPYDGHGRWQLVCLELNNKDLIAGWLWVWYNK